MIVDTALAWGNDFRATLTRARIPLASGNKTNWSKKFRGLRFTLATYVIPLASGLSSRRASSPPNVWRPSFNSLCFSNPTTRLRLCSPSLEQMLRPSVVCVYYPIPDKVGRVFNVHLRPMKVAPVLFPPA
jgi:hypothetical protein